MDLSRQTTEELLVLQRAAGYLNVSVDELLQIQRRPPNSASSLGGSGNRPVYNQNDSSFADQQHFTSFHANGTDDIFWDNSQDQNVKSLQQDVSEFALADVPSFRSEQPGLDQHSLSGSSQHVSEPAQQERVILLNPQIEHAWFACNNDYDTIEFDDISSSDQRNSSGTDGFVQLTPKSHDSDAESESTARDDEMDIDSADEDTLSVPTPADRRSSSSMGSRQFKLIAPRPGTMRSPSDGSSPGLSSHRVRKKRARYSASNRVDTNLTRSLNACVRCRIQRNRCIPDPNNPRGPCQPCQNKKARLSRLPCLRYKLSDSTLFRTGLDYMPFYKAHPMTGPHYGDFHIEKHWINGSGRVLCLSQDRGSFLRIELKQFVPPHDPTALDLKGRSMYDVNWAIADPDAVTEALNEFIDDSLGCYLESILDGMDGLVWDIFHAAIRASVFPQPNLLLRKTLRLWVVCRFIESRWRCWTDQEDEDITKEFPEDPFYDWISPPPYVDYQFASIVIHRVLMPLREEILRELEKMVEKHKPEDWYVTFLSSFILLQNYELQMQFQREFAQRRNAPVRYLDMPLVRATNSGAKTILAHFHYCCKGNQPFGERFDWNAAKIRRMARLDAEQSRFMASYRDRVIAKAEVFSQINHSDQYDNMYWYTSQLFDPDWKPRDTLEHAPAVEWSH